MEKAFFTVKEVAERISVSPKTIYRLIDEDKLGFIKIRRCVRIPENEIIRLEEKLAEAEK